MPNSNYITAIMAAVAFIPLHAAGQDKSCIPTLVKDVKVLSESSAVSYALSRVIDQKASSDEKNKIGVAIPIDGVPVELTSDRSRRFVSKFYEKTGINWDETRSLAMVTQSLSSNAVEAYRTCIDGEHKSGPRAHAYNATADEVTIFVKWISPVGAPTSAKGVVDISGGQLLSSLNEFWHTGESRVFIVKRDKKRDIRIAINIGGEAVPGGVFVPYVPRVRVTPLRKVETYPSIKDSPLRLLTDSRGSRMDMSRCLAAPPGVEIDHASANTSIELKAGPFDDTTFVKINRQKSNYAMICWDAALIPLVAKKGGDMYFRIVYPTITWDFEVLE